MPPASVPRPYFCAGQLKSFYYLHHIYDLVLDARFFISDNFKVLIALDLYLERFNTFSFHLKGIGFHSVFPICIIVFAFHFLSQQIKENWRSRGLSALKLKLSLSNLRAGTARIKVLISRFFQIVKSFLSMKKLRYQQWCWLSSLFQRQPL